MSPIDDSYRDRVGMSAPVRSRRREVSPIKLLFVAANCERAGSLASDREAKAIQDTLRSARFGGQFELLQEWAVAASEMRGCLLRHNPTIVHFSAHGTEAGELLLEDHGGEDHRSPMDASRLAQLFHVLQGDVRLVVLNACFTETHARALGRHVDCVVGISREIRDGQARVFSRAFYEALAYGKDVQTAFDLARTEMGPSEANATPVMSSKVDTSRVVFVHTSPNSDDAALVARGPVARPEISGQLFFCSMAGFVLQMIVALIVSLNAMWTC